MPGQGRLGDKAQVTTDAHGCPGCPHPGIGPAIAGSADVFVNGKPALRVEDHGIHAACCGANTWEAIAGSASVFINGKAAHRIGDKTQHCGGQGQLAEGSRDVLVGNGASGAIARDPKGWITVHLKTKSGTPLAGRRYRLQLPDGTKREGRLDDSGALHESGFKSGACKVSFPEDDDG